MWDPHTPYRTPLSFEPSFESDPPPSWMTEEIIKEHRDSYGPRSARDLGGFDRLKLTQFYKRIQGIREIENLDDFTKWINAYDIGIRYADDFVGKVIQILRTLEIYDDTLIIISSDHGECQGELNVYGDHATACHIINRVPMILKWPQKKWKKQYDSLIYATDISATIIEGVGKNVPNFWDGRSVFKELENGTRFGRNFLVFGQDVWTCQRAVRFQNWTMIRTYHTGLRDYPEIMLYDFEKDFHMTTNIAEERPDIVCKGLQLLDEWHDKMMKSSPSSKDPMWTVIEEGGPHHTKGMRNTYLKRLRRSGREEFIEVIKRRNEAD